MSLPKIIWCTETGQECVLRCDDGYCMAYNESRMPGSLIIKAPRMPPMPQSTKERQEALRARRAMLGMTEVRGIYLPPELHAELKAYAKKLAKNRRTAIDRQSSSGI